MQGLSGEGNWDGTTEATASLPALHDIAEIEPLQASSIIAVADT